MKILMLRANPRKNGVSEKLADIFVEGMKLGGAEIFDIDLTAKKIEMCRGCFACSAEPRVCVIDDDMREILKIADSAEAIVCVSPVYFYAMSAQLKCFFDRCFPFVRGYVLDKKTGEMRNEMGFAVRDKKFATIGIASGRKSSFGAMSQTYKTIADAMGFDYVADIRRGESPFFEIKTGSSVRMNKIISAFSAAGKEFAEIGSISQKTIALAEADLAESDAAYAKHTALYWRLLGSPKKTRKP